ncbi:MAG: PAS domain S-box protein [Anaerolineae bacterium]|nr:PAS domain S-box protein [Anaerolineae bacterium]
MVRLRLFISRLLNVSSTDPDDARRRKLLNVLLGGVGLLTLIALAMTVAGSILAPEQVEPVLYMASLGMFFAVGLIFALNRYGSGGLASTLFIVMLTGIMALAEAPKETIAGRSLVVYTIPIIMASFILRPYASFAAAILISAMMAVIGMVVQVFPNIMGMIAFFVIAFVSWLAARSLEQTLTELRLINRELDQRVEARTQELARTLSQNQAILESIADGVIVFDRSGKAVVANPAIARLLDYPDSGIIGRDVAALMAENVQSEEQEVMINLVQGNAKSYPTFKLEWGIKTLSVSCAPVQVESEPTTGTVAVFRDFTREAELERMKGVFVSMVSHELRTPLNAILGYAEMLHEGIYGQLDEKQREAIQRILANTRRQLSLVNDLLDQAQIEAGTLALNFTTVKPADLIREMHSTMIVLAMAKGLELNCHIDNDVPEMVQGDPQRLHQILINLVNNAVKFTERGQVEANVFRSDEDHWAIQIRDTGPGIALEAQGYIFEPFRRADDSATRKHSGAGLGLSIVKQLVNLMGGEIILTSRIGQGSTFTVRLPIASRAQRETK